MKSKLESIFVILIMLLSIANIKFCADAILSLSDNTEKRYIAQSDIKSNQYLVTDEYIARISPKTMVESFVMQIGLEDKEIAIYEDENKEVEVQEGLISTGMVMTVSEKEEALEEETQETENSEIEQENADEIEGTEQVQEDEEVEANTEGAEENEETEETQKTEEDYKLSVVGDTNNDGNANIVEVVQIINHLAGFEGKEIVGIELVSSDINGDTEVNLIDIDKLIRYIVFEELEIGEVGAPKEPIIELEGEEIEGWYKGDVKVIIKTQEEEFLKTVYTIDEETKETTNKIEEETIRQNGVHKVEAYTYGKNQSKSIVAEKEVKIDKEAPIITKINRTTEEETTEAVRVEIIAEDNQSGLAKEAYSFDGGATWQEENYKEYTTNQEEIKIQVKDKVGNIREETINIQNIVQEKTKYKVEFKNEDGTVLQSEELEEGTIPEYKGEEPTKAEDETYTYEFAGWSPEITQVTGNQEYTATYTETYKNYTITFKDEDGSIISIKEDYHYGDTVEEPEEPTKAEDETYTYEFAGWSPEITQVAGNAEYTATYTATYKNYTITFKDEDGSIISIKEDYHYGDTVEIPQENPTKQQEGCIFTFAGWDKETTPVNGNQEYIATYTKELIEYTIEYELNGGTVETENPTTYNVETESFTLNNPSKKWYRFIGWTLNEETQAQENITIEKGSIGNRKYTANWELEGENVKVKETNKVYASIEMALEELGNGETIILLNNTNENIEIGENKTITIDLNGKTIINKSETEATIINEGTLTIVDDSGEQTGQVENTNNTAIINDGTLTIGYDDGIIEENVIVKGATNAIQNNSNFYMYDGSLIGKTTITGNDAIIPEGEEYGLSIKEENGMQIATIEIIEIPEALVGETYYMTLQQAIDENNNTTIYVVKKDIELINALTIDETKDLTIDLNGSTLRKESTGYVIENSGTLTITNTIENQKGNISNTVGYAINNKSTLNVKNINMSRGIYNQKDLNIEDVNIESIYSYGYGVYNKHTSNDINFIMIGGSITGSGYAIYNSKNQGSSVTGNVYVQISDASIEGGIYNSTTDSNGSEIAVEIVNTTMNSKNCAITNYGSGDFRIKDSNIEVEGSRQFLEGIYLSGGPNNLILENTKINISNNTYTSRAIYSSGEYNVVIDKGTQVVSTSTSGNAYGFYGASTAAERGIIQLLDGTISANTESSSKSYVGYAVYLHGGSFDFLGGTLNATTQTINSTIGRVAEGKQIQTIQDGNQYVSTLVDVENREYIASIGEEKFYSLKDAVDACINTEESTKITILCDYEQFESIEISEDKNIIIDLNGHKITSYSEFINQGKLEITDSSEGQLGTIEGKGSRAVLNKGNAIFTFNGGNIVFNNREIGKCLIYNMDQASINIKNGILNIDTRDSNAASYLIYNVSIGNVEITGGELQGNNNYGTLYGIYNYVDKEGGDRNINISGGSMNLNYSSQAYGIHNYTYNNTSDIFGDTINLNISNYSINIEGSYSSRVYGIYNNTGVRDEIIVNLDDSILNVYNNYGGAYGGAYGVYNNSEQSFSHIYNNIVNSSIQADGRNKNEFYGIYNSTKNTTVSLGVPGEESNISETRVFGKEYGIHSDSRSTINFFQGIIKGTTAISDKAVLTLEDGKEINRYTDETDNYDTIVIQNKTPEAKIGETEYMTLQEAVDDCPDDLEEFTTIELIKEINNNTQTITIGENKKVVLDLKGYKLTSNAERTILNNGELNIVDTVGGSEIKNNTKIAVGNYGTLKVDNIKIYGYSSGVTNYRDSNAELNQVEIDSSSTGINNYANMIVNNSKIIMADGSYGVYNNYGNVDIIDSEISVTNGGTTTYGIYSYGANGIVNIKNSNITSIDNTSQPYYSRGYGIYISSGTVNIGEKDNNVADNSTITSSHIGIYKGGGSLNYYGGTITAGERAIQGSIDDTPDNKTIYIDEETNTMTLIDEEEKDVVQIGDITYNSLAKAVEAVQEGQEESTEIKVIADFDISSIDEQVDINENQKVKLDLNGHTITSYRMNAINNKGELEITDTSESQEGKIVSKLYTGINNTGEFILNQGTIQAVRNCIHCVDGNITVNGGLLEILAEDRDSSSAIYAGNSSNVKLVGGIIKGTRNKYSLGTKHSKYLAGIEIESSNIEMDGTKIVINNTTEYDAYGIICYKSTVNFKSGNIEVVSSNGFGSSYGISGFNYNYINQDGNDIRISGGNIKVTNATHAYGVYLKSYYNQSKLTMTGGNIETYNNTDNYASTAICGYSERKNTIINILGGTVTATGTSSGTAISGSTNSTYATTVEIIIGTKDGNISKTTPEIEGGSYGISGGNIYFYDGIIKGPTAITQLPVDVEDGYKLSVATSEEIQTATLTKISTAEAIAQIGNLYFDNLQKAINACKTGEETIKLLVHINSTETLNISEEQIVTIDLNGFTITGNIENNGTLNITNNKGTVAEGSYGTITGTGTINVQ